MAEPPDSDNYRKACEAHPDIYQETSSAINEVGEEWNPRLHLIMHQMVLNQIDEVTAVKDAYEELSEKHKLHPHSAIHVLSNVLSEEIYDMLQTKREYDPEVYERKLSNMLNRNSTEYRKLIKPFQHGKPPKHPEIN
ncbi:DUF1841 family protein [Candidatus Bipolaricaulota bacterium]|nr:DUF1841 family protein [Candidatus Bipolaricaulota bacterium]MBS3813854.1 DUF1841 family protein [Candidatus Bipolaricaulota bacterium]